jgi:hypothetical protein
LAQWEEVLGIGDEVGVLDVSYRGGKQLGAVRRKQGAVPQKVV